MFLDVQYDRGRDDALGETPMLAIQEENDEGIVVRGWKAIGTTIPFVNELLIGNLWRPGQTPEQTIYALVPVEHAGRLDRGARVARRSPTRTRTTARSPRSATSSTGWSTSTTCSSRGTQVQHVGNPDHAKWYPQRQFDWVHLETQIRHCVHAELMVGLALLLTEALGTSKSPVVQSQLADLVRYRETLPRVHDRRGGDGLPHRRAVCTSRTTSSSTSAARTTSSTSTRW